ncbi:unnamed protein product [Jaminaea pallidilutea]
MAMNDGDERIEWYPPNCFALREGGGQRLSSNVVLAYLKRPRWEWRWRRPSDGESNERPHASSSQDLL